MISSFEPRTGVLILRRTSDETADAAREFWSFQSSGGSLAERGYLNHHETRDQQTRLDNSGSSAGLLKICTRLYPKATKFPGHRIDTGHGMECISMIRGSLNRPDCWSRIILDTKMSPVSCVLDTTSYMVVFGDQSKYPTLCSG
jgi:hypothetical protein